MLSRYLIPFLILALGVAASPVVVRHAPVSLPIAKRVGLNGLGNLLQHDRARAKALLDSLKRLPDAHSKSASAFGSVPVINTAVTYVAEIGVGKPPTAYELLVDTGSSNTWIGPQFRYAKTTTSKRTNNRVTVKYGFGSFEGDQYTDTVTLGGELVIDKQSIGVASLKSGFDFVDGILGVGPAGLTKGTLSPGVNETIPTVTDNLFSQGKIPANLLAVSYRPTTFAGGINGQLTFGQVDDTRYIGGIDYQCWGIDQNITYGQTKHTILETTAGIVDTGTTLCLLATDAFQAYEKATGAVLDNTTGLLRITPERYQALQSLYFNVNGKAYELTPDAQRWPKDYNLLIGGRADVIYLIVADLGGPSGQGLDFVNGYTFLERFYSVYDTDKKQIGLAYTPWTNSTDN